MKNLLLMLSLLFSSYGFTYNSEIHTSVSQVDPEGTCEQVGLLAIAFDEDDLASASPETPIYIRITFDKNATLCETRVWDNDANPDITTREPIQLAISAIVSDSQPGLQVDAPADSVSIVRWKAGETQIWLRVDRSSSIWLTNGTISSSIKVVFGFGENASNDMRYHAYYAEQNYANLAGNTRSDEVIDTSIRLDLSDSNLELSPSNIETQTILNFNLVSFEPGHANASESPENAFDTSDIVLGQLIQPFFSADNPIAKGVQLPRSVTLLDLAPGWTLRTTTLLELVEFVNQ